jgi:hypothetical protein
MRRKRMAECVTAGWLCDSYGCSEDIMAFRKYWILAMPPFLTVTTTSSQSLKSDELERDNFVLLGSYQPREAAKLLERFHEAGIAFRTQPRSPPPEPEPTVVIDISVDPVRASEVAQIHRDLFGDGLPNYASSFFREHGNV